MIARPTFIALDTSHLAGWSKDSVSPSATERSAALAFTDWLERSGTIPLLTLHHIAELCVHDDGNLVASRLRFLHRLPLVAWIPDVSGQAPGTVASILTAEALAAYDRPDDDIVAVRDTVRPGLIRVGCGQDMLGPDPEAWSSLTAEFSAGMERDRELVALTHSDFIDIRDVPIAKLLGGRRHDDAKLDRILAVMRGSLARDIAEHGDRRIPTPRNVADRFVSSVRSMAAELPRDPVELVWSALALQGIEPHDVDPESTLGDVLTLGVFLQRLKIAIEGRGLPWIEVKKRVRMSRIPSFMISQEVKARLPKTAERKGSEAPDLDLATLAAYADVTMVDKRTEEAFRQARRNNALLDRVCRKVAKASSYRVIPAMLDRM